MPFKASSSSLKDEFFLPKELKSFIIKQKNIMWHFGINWMVPLSGPPTFLRRTWMESKKGAWKCILPYLQNTKTWDNCRAGFAYLTSKTFLLIKCLSIVNRNWLRNSCEAFMCSDRSSLCSVPVFQKFRNYWRPSLFAVLLFAVLTIHIKFMLSLTPVLSELAIRGSAIHIQIFLERNSRE